MRALLCLGFCFMTVNVYADSYRCENKRGTVLVDVKDSQIEIDARDHRFIDKSIYGEHRGRYLMTPSRFAGYEVINKKNNLIITENLGEHFMSCSIKYDLKPKKSTLKIKAYCLTFLLKSDRVNEKLNCVKI